MNSKSSFVLFTLFLVAGFAIADAHARLLSLLAPQATNFLAQINFEQGYEGEAAGSSSFSSGSAPTITILGNNPAVVEKNASYVDLGVQVSDDTSSDVELKVTGATIDTRIPGVYTVTYVAVDQDKNRTVAYRTVLVRDASGNAPTVQNQPPATPYVAPSETYPLSNYSNRTETESSIPVPQTRRNGYSVRSVLTKGDTSSEVRRLQRLLAQDSELYPSQRITGVYDEATFTAVARFQKRENITPSKGLSASYGEADFATRYRLEQLYSLPEEVAAEAAIPTFTNVPLKDALLILTAQILEDASLKRQQALSYIRSKTGSFAEFLRSIAN